MEKIYGQFDLETIEKLADIINKKELSELTIADGDKTITIKGKKCVPAYAHACSTAAAQLPHRLHLPMESTLAEVRLQWQRR